jgi:hypothetical protein
LRSGSRAATTSAALNLQPDGSKAKAYQVRQVRRIRPKASALVHVFRKKSQKGIETPKHVIDLIRARLKTAEPDYREQKAAE